MLKYEKLFAFLILNFLVLGLSRLIMADGLNSDWYAQTAKAPWTPPAWFFGAAWFTIMAAFAVYLSRLSTTGRWRFRNRLVYALTLFCA